ncbi:LysM peptidoglycan-binding domain-containing protein [Flavobacterium sp. SUN052]|uniref:LysM peptidoglycan-binding domain-containing protein n=1 Tax=Flavobacterium sp. SUN052 TaxID=3002441 RepID=UPI00237D8682|nr:LysM peptidoglycan-binding domain-containing protein [Flavobacterium sp. SUN052]MEC4003737.1 LysM peptidoglycan-binding domain-containing protein [Flavobacterium sp. SUN052]
MKKLTLLLVLFFVQVIYSQQANTYHVVASGETLSSIAQKYKVTPYDIIKLNPKAVDGINEKEVLIIPRSLVEPTTKSVENKISNSSVGSNKNQNILIHIVQSKETKFGLSKSYGISIQELETQNPHIVNGLQVGQKLEIKGTTTNFKQNLLESNKLSSFNSKFDYTVLPGETLYGISKRNGITVDELTKANSTVLNGILKSGQKLSIPVRGESGSLNNSIVTSNNSKYHLVEPKETKFGLSKKYGVTIEQLETLNPQIVKGLQIGQKLILPNSYSGTDFTSTKVEIAKVSENKVENKPSVIISNQEYIDYEVQPKETLFGLSKKAGMTTTDFIDLNPKLSQSVQIGMIVKMPKNGVSPTEKATTKEVSKVVTEKVIPITNSDKNNIISNSKYKDLTTTIDKSVRKKVTFVLPFSEVKYQEYVSKSPQFNEVNDDFIKRNLELYSGALKAIDSAKTLGLNVEIKTIELQNDATNVVVDSLSNNEIISQSNALILPYYDLHAEYLASKINSKNIPVVTTQLTNQLEGVSNLYVAVPSDRAIRNTILDYLKSKNANTIVVNSTNRIQSKNSISELYSDAKFVKVSDRNVVDIEDLKTLLVKGKLNYVILDTDKSSMIISTTNTLLNESSEFQIQIVVLDEALLSSYTNISSIRMNILKMIYPSYNSIDKAAKMGASIQKIAPKSDDEINQNYVIGFDMTLDTLLRLSQSKDFESSTNEDVTECIKLRFEYKKDKFSSNVNQGFYILQHDTDGKIKVLTND